MNNDQAVVVSYVNPIGGGMPVSSALTLGLRGRACDSPALCSACPQARMQGVGQPEPGSITQVHTETLRLA